MLRCADESQVYVNDSFLLTDDGERLRDIDCMAVYLVCTDEHD